MTDDFLPQRFCRYPFLRVPGRFPVQKNPHIQDFQASPSRKRHKQLPDALLQMPAHVQTPACRRAPLPDVPWRPMYPGHSVLSPVPGPPLLSSPPPPERRAYPLINPSISGSPREPAVPLLKCGVLPAFPPGFPFFCRSHPLHTDMPVLRLF